MRHEPEYRFLSEADKKLINISNGCRELEKIEVPIESLLYVLAERLIREQDCNPIVLNVSVKDHYTTSVKVIKEREDA